MSEKNGISTGKIFIAIGSVSALAVITVLVVVVVNLLQREPERERIYVQPDTGARGTVVTEENLEEVLEMLQSPSQDTSYSVQMNTSWNFPSGRSESTNAYVANSILNTRTVYFDVVLNDTNELVYSSPYLPVGTDISGFALDAVLEAGQYQARVIYHLVDDDLNEITTASMSTTLNIES